MSYNPGTMFRAYPNTDKSKHYTAVLLKNGKVLEVKNPDNGAKTTYDSLELWQAEHPDCTFETDTSRSSGVVIGSDTNGFNYPNEKNHANGWVRWCYSMVKEAAPQLLSSEELRLAYNKMVEVCDKHKEELRNDSYETIYRYSSQNIYWTTDKNYYNARWCGFGAYFVNEQYYRTGQNKRYTKEEYDVARKEIVDAYKAVLDIITPHIKDYMAKKHKIIRAKRDIGVAKRSVQYCEKKMTEFQNRITNLKSYIEVESLNLMKWEAELRS
jgi:hypothetical protein